MTQVPISRQQHADTHYAGGPDEFAAGATVNANARVGVRKNSTGSTFLRRRINVIEGAGIALTVADDSPGEEVDVTVDATPSILYAQVFS